MKMKRISWSLLLIFTIVLNFVSCFSTHHRSTYQDAENIKRTKSINYEDISSSDSTENNHKNVNSFVYRSRNDEDYAEYSKISRNNVSEADGIAIQTHFKDHNERDNVRSQHNKNHHHHYKQPQNHAKEQEKDDEAVTAASVNHHHFIPPVIKNGVEDATTTKNKKKNNNHKHLKHSTSTTHKEPVQFSDEMSFLLSNNLNRINNNNNNDDDEDDDEENTYFAETRNNKHNNNREVDGGESDIQKDKFQFDLPNKDYVDFEKVMQNSGNKFNDANKNNNNMNRRKVSENDDEDQDEDEENDDDDNDDANEDSYEEVEENQKRKTSVIAQFPSEITVSTIEKEDQIVKQQQQRRQEHRKGSKLLEKRHKINDEGPLQKLNIKHKTKPIRTTIYQNIVRGDLSCMRDEDFTPAPAIENADIKYLRNDIYGVENSFLEAEYHCHKGYKLVSLSQAQDDQGEQVSIAPGGSFTNDKYNKEESSEIVQVMNTTNLICHNKEWVGNFIPKCIKIKGKNLDKLCSSENKCEQMCFLRNLTGLEQCTCFKGFKMVNNACVDINECTETRNNCEHQCINTIGSYTCRCMPGFQYDWKHKCKDINECTLHGNTKGPCQDKCINLPGSYKCTCDNLPGTKLATDGHSCVIVSLSSSAAISQQILSSSATVVSVCPRGYYFNYTNDECEDFDECSVNNGGCQDICTNTDGSYYCSCQSGYIFGPDNKTCVVNNITSDVTCPPLIPPKHGYLECSRPLDESRHHIANFPGSQCVLRCPNGFRVMGRYSQICGNDGQWQGSGDGACIRYPKPKLICPKNMMLETPPNDTRVVMPLPRPTTDVSWETDITITPNYVKDLNLVLSSGVENITYIATHPISRLRVSCQFSVNVLDGMPPVVKFCPETQHYTVAKHHETIKVSWIEPIFEDNIKVTKITKSNESGNHLGLGTHLITYEAKDAAGFTSRCTFKIVINAPKRQILPLLYSKFYYL